MRKTLGFLALLCLLSGTSLADCTLDVEKAKPDYLEMSNCFFPLNIFPQTITKTQFWNGYISNGGPAEVAFLNWSVPGTGRCWGSTFCWPDFFAPRVIYPPLTGTAVFEQRVKSYVLNSIQGPC